jgi:hypothetical protein
MQINSPLGRYPDRWGKFIIKLTGNKLWLSGDWSMGIFKMNRLTDLLTLFKVDINNIIPNLDTIAGS